MKKFVVLYYMTPNEKKKSKTLDDEKKKELDSEWENWIKMCGKNLVDIGSPLGEGMFVSMKKTGPVKNQLAGYSILQARNLIKIEKLLQDHPHIKCGDGCTIEVFETMPM